MSNLGSVSVAQKSQGGSMRPATYPSMVNVAKPSDNAYALQQEIMADKMAQRMRDELELIGYATSHDLQSPLRTILSCCEELDRSPALSADAAARDNVQLLQKEAARMRVMMQGMLEYIRLETFATSSAKLDSNELVAAAKAALAQEIQDSGAVVVGDNLPPVMGHRGRLTRLFSYLIENAIKFRGKAAPIVTITARPEEAMWEFCVQDNGIGIEEDHHDIIFRLFQRLQTAEAYPGNGIGLGLSRKIVEAHGGSMRVESERGEGSRFYFTLPAA